MVRIGMMSVLQQRSTDQRVLSDPSIHLESLETPSRRDRGSNDVPPEGTQTFTPPNAAAVKTKLIAASFVMLMAGMNDAATGALIPYIQPAYDVGTLFVAIVYLVNFSGWVVGAFTIVHVTAHFGMSGAFVVGVSSQFLAYCLNFWKPPFPLFAVSFFFSGLGVAYQDATANTFVASMDNAHRWLGLMHAIYGLGAFVTPLAATGIASKTPYWHYFYLILLGCTAINLAMQLWAWRKELFKPSESDFGANKQLKAALSDRGVWVLSLFFFLYVGSEVTAGGWVVEFLISVRNGQPSSVGYVASGFWGGLALGRIVLADITSKLGERRMIFVYIAIGLVMQLLFWFIPNIIANAVVVSFLGFIIGPFFPAGISIITKLLPRHLHTASIGFSSSFGQAGSAAFPFLTGAIASAKGVIVLQPIMCGLLAGMFIMWALLPRVKKQAE